MTAQHTATTVLTGGLTVTEAPRWYDGALWFSDFFSHRVLRFDPTSGTADTVCEVPGQPSGLGFMPDGELRIVSMTDCRLLAWDGSALRTVAEFGDRVTGPANDLAITRDGTAFVGNFGADPSNPDIVRPTSLLAVSPDGVVSVAAEDIVFPNGIVIDEDAAELLVVETYRCRITAFPLADGRLGARRTWVEFAPDPGAYDVPLLTPQVPMVPDGIAIDRTGALWVADAKGHGATRVTRDGTVTDFVDTGDLSVYSVALGGADGRDLFLCCAPATGTVDPVAVERGAVLHARVAVGA